jgi:3-hydroxybutyrate dehydrogenase
MNLDFTGRIVLITGASRGIGLGIAEAFAAAGAMVHMLAEDPAVVGQAKRLGGKAHVADITDAPRVEAVLGQFTRIDVLINNAGIECLTPLDDLSAETERKFRRIIEVNVIGTDLFTRRALTHMSSGASIINTSSTWGRVAEPLFGAYVASKHALIGLTRTWARELGQRGIRVNAVCPGWVRTSSAMASLGHLAERSGQPEEALLAQIIAGQALSGLMEASDVAGPYLYLASDLAKNVTGQALGVDRGEVPW